MTAIVQKNNVLLYKGSRCMNQRLVLSILSQRPIRIVDIRAEDDDPGLQAYELSLIRLLDKITNGTVVQVDRDNTSFKFQPGLLHGGAFEHDCHMQRGLGYYLEVLLMLGVFCKVPLNVTLRGVTNNNIDPSVDHISAAFLPVLKKFILEDEDLQIKVLKRGMLPLGGGEVNFQCPIKRTLRPMKMLDAGLVKRIRGIAYALRVSPNMSNRMVSSAKGVLTNFIPDVYINTDQRKGKQSGKSPGFGIHLVAETTNGVFYVGEQVCNVVSEGQEVSIPEDMGRLAANKLLKSIYFGGCADMAAQSTAVLCMALSQNNVSTMVVGPLSEYTQSFLQHLREFFGITFKLEYVNDEEDNNTIRGSDKVLMTCMGVGYTNINKKLV